MSYFVFITLRKTLARRYIDALILLSNPNEKNAAHITLQGPLDSPPDLEAIENDFLGKPIHVLGCGKFFGPNQNTVFLHCGSPTIKKHWSKKHYDSNPHITIYDGPSRDFAERLYGLLSSNRLFFEIDVERIICLPHHPGQKSFNLFFEVDTEALREVIGKEFDLTKLHKLSEHRRMAIIERLIPKMLWEIQNYRIKEAR